VTTFTDDGLAWPDAGHALFEELSAARGRFALITAAAPSAADDVVVRLRDDIGARVVSLGRAVAESHQPPTTDELDIACGDATVITDIDLLLWPALRVPVVPFLAARRGRRTTVAVWPGRITAGRATYSAPGRPDHYDIALRDVIVLRPRPTRFPDEVPFDIERILP
jgi:hypothetical protein